MTRTNESSIFQEVLECAPDAMLIVDPAGVIILVNRRAEELFGYSREDLTGHAVEVLVPKACRGSHADQRSQFQADPHYRAMGLIGGISGRHHDGTIFPADVSLGPLHRQGATYTVVAVRNLTQVRKAEQASARLLERVRELETELDRLRSEHPPCPLCAESRETPDGLQHQA